MSNGAAGSGAAPTLRPSFTRGEPTEFQDNVGYGGEVFVSLRLRQQTSELKIIVHRSTNF